MMARPWAGVSGVPSALLKVYPPDQKSYLTAFFSWTVCAKKGPVYMFVKQIQPGTPNPNE